MVGWEILSWQEPKKEVIWQVNLTIIKINRMDKYENCCVFHEQVFSKNLFKQVKQSCVIHNLIAIYFWCIVRAYTRQFLPYS